MGKAGYGDKGEGGVCSTGPERASGSGWYAAQRCLGKELQEGGRAGGPGVGSPGDANLGLSPGGPCTKQAAALCPGFPSFSLKKKNLANQVGRENSHHILLFSDGWGGVGGQGLGPACGAA